MSKTPNYNNDQPPPYTPYMGGNPSAPQTIPGEKQQNFMIMLLFCFATVIFYYFFE